MNSAYLHCTHNGQPSCTKDLDKNIEAAEMLSYGKQPEKGIELLDQYPDSDELDWHPYSLEQKKTLRFQRRRLEQDICDADMRRLFDKRREQGLL